jgi:hypothetical protein
LSKDLNTLKLAMSLRHADIDEDNNNDQTGV